MPIIPRLAAVLLLMPSAAAGGAERDPCGDDLAVICATRSPWYRATGVRLRVLERGVEGFGEWNLSIQDPLNLAIDVETTRDGKSNKGKVLLVGERVMLSKGLALERGYEIDAFTEPVMYYQLVAGLLWQVFPAGPERFADSLVAAADETKRGIRIATSQATGQIIPPWNLRGWVRRKGRQSIDFALTLDFPLDSARNSPRRVLVFDGTWRKAPRPPVLDAKMQLEGWSAHAIGPTTPIRQEGAAILDYGRASPVVLHTLGELQAALRRHKPASGKAK